MEYIIDIEASGLGAKSYPIEIAYTSIDGTVQGSFLINPLTSKKNWDYWDEYAEKNIHKIPCELLTKDGISVQEAAEFVNDLFSDNMVYSDAPVWDEEWITTLFDGTDGLFPYFRISDAYDLVGKDDANKMREVLANTKKEHRALSDAKALRDVVANYITT